MKRKIRIKEKGKPDKEIEINTRDLQLLNVLIHCKAAIHKAKKGKGSFSRKKKHKKSSEEY